MATYASSSNPFIKTNTCSATGGSSDMSDVPKRKVAPGMAMPHSQLLMDTQRKPEDKKKTSTYNSDEEAKDNRFRDEEGPKVDIIVDLNLNHLVEEPAPQSIADHSSKGDHVDDEITEACESLVETTIRLELEEAAAFEKMGCTNENREKSQEVQQECDKKNEMASQKVSQLNEVEDIDAAGLQDEDSQDSSGHRQHIELIRKLRLQLRDLERYAYERGELGQVPASVIAERQTVILDTLKERLSLSIDMNEIEKLELDELKKQVDKEIHDLIDPLITKDHLLGQLKAQLTDLERYISYLHGTIGKIHDKSTCTCRVHGCCTSKLAELVTSDYETGTKSTGNINNESRLTNNDALPKTTKLIRSLVTQLICSDIKLRESAKKAQKLENERSIRFSQDSSAIDINKRSQGGGDSSGVLKEPALGKATIDDAAWTLHIDKVILATDSLVNLFTTEPEYQRPTDNARSSNVIDDRLVESIVRRQLVPALRDLLTYGLIDLSSMPRSTSYVSLLFDPYYLLTSLTCFPGGGSSRGAPGSLGGSSTSGLDKVHLWNVIEEYYSTRNDHSFKTSSVKTLSQSFDLAPSISGPIKITSKQALLIAIDDINETLAQSKPNGPESHFRAFIYTALNRAKLATWLRIIFKNKSINKQFYHNFSFVSQPDKMDRLLATIEPLSQLSFKLRTDIESIEQFVSAF